MITNTIQTIHPTSYFFPSLCFITSMETMHCSGMHHSHLPGGELKNLIQPLIDAHPTGTKNLLTINRILQRFKGGGIVVGIFHRGAECKWIGVESQGWASGVGHGFHRCEEHGGFGKVPVFPFQKLGHGFIVEDAEGAWEDLGREVEVSHFPTHQGCLIR